MDVTAYQVMGHVSAISPTMASTGQMLDWNVPQEVTT